MEDLGICVTNPHTVHFTVFLHNKRIILLKKQCQLVCIAECVSTHHPAFTVCIQYVQGLMQFVCGCVQCVSVCILLKRQAAFQTSSLLGDRHM